jgi:hypothetical protein
MAVRVLFRCELCDALPDEVMHRTLSSLLRDRTLGELLDAQPGGWLLWTAGGALGPKRYACPAHRQDLIDRLRRSYGAVRSQVWTQEPYRAVWPSGFSGLDEQELEKLLGAEATSVRSPAHAPDHR